MTYRWHPGILVENKKLIDERREVLRQQIEAAKAIIRELEQELELYAGYGELKTEK